MLCDTVIIFDHIFQSVKIVSHVFAPQSSSSDLEFIYNQAVSKTQRIAKLLANTAAPVPNIHQPPIPPKSAREQPVSNVGKPGYEAFVTKLKQHILAGDIIQAVPSQRLIRREPQKMDEPRFSISQHPGNSTCQMDNVAKLLNSH